MIASQTRNARLFIISVLIVLVDEKSSITQYHEVLALTRCDKASQTRNARLFIISVLIVLVDEKSSITQYHEVLALTRCDKASQTRNARLFIISVLTVLVDEKSSITQYHEVLALRVKLFVNSQHNSTLNALFEEVATVLVYAVDVTGCVVGVCCTTTRAE